MKKDHFKFRKRKLAREMALTKLKEGRFKGMKTDTSGKKTSKLRILLGFAILITIAYLAYTYLL